MSMRSDSEMEGYEEAHRAFETLAQAIVNPGAKLMRRLGDAVVEDIDRRFNTRGYGTWPELKPATAKRKGNDFVLVETGAMRSSTIISSMGPTEVTVSVPYGGAKHDAKVPGYHQEGTSRMPERAITKETPQLDDALEKAATLWLEDMIKATQVSV